MKTNKNNFGRLTKREYIATHLQLTDGDTSGWSITTMEMLAGMAQAGMAQGAYRVVSES